MYCRDLCVLSGRLCPRAWSEQRLGLAICIYSRHASVAGGLSRTSIAHTRATRRLSARHTCPGNRRAARESVRARARRALQWLARRRRRAPPEWHRRRVAGRAAVPLGIHSHQLRVSVSGAQRCHCAAPRRRGRAHRAERYGGGRAHTYTALHLGACFPLFARSVPASRGALLRRLHAATQDAAGPRAQRAPGRPAGRSLRQRRKLRHRAEVLRSGGTDALVCAGRVFRLVFP